jgi:hypothetical protein
MFEGSNLINNFSLLLSIKKFQVPLWKLQNYLIFYSISLRLFNVVVDIRILLNKTKKWICYSMFFIL